MKVAHLGHAGLKIEMAGTTVVVDPWFSPEGAFQASWFQYPNNSHLIAPSLFNPKAIVISHEHLDHVDPWFLSRVPSHIPVIIHRYPSPALRRKVLAGGYRPIVELSAWERYEFPGEGSVFFVPEESPMNHDAAIVIQGDDHSLLNLNDARLSPVQFREIRARLGGTIDLFSLQGAGASWYPQCYEYPDKIRREFSRRKRFAKFAYVARAINVVEPVTTFHLCRSAVFPRSGTIPSQHRDRGRHLPRSATGHGLACHARDQEHCRPATRRCMGSRRTDNGC